MNNAKIDRISDENSEDNKDKSSMNRRKILYSDTERSSDCKSVKKLLFNFALN